MTPFNLNNWLQDLELDADWISSIDPDLATHQTISQTPAYFTIPDVAVTPITHQESDLGTDATTKSAYTTTGQLEMHNWPPGPA